MKYNIYNYEEQEDGVLLGCIETDLKGRATLHLGGDGKGQSGTIPTAPPPCARCAKYAAGRMPIWLK